MIPKKQISRHNPVFQARVLMIFALEDEKRSIENKALRAMQLCDTKIVGFYKGPPPL